MNCKITIRNYRSIPYNRPLELSLSNGITFILGINNVGKTNLLKFFYEFRPVFESLQRSHHNVVGLTAPFDALVHRESMDHPIFFEFFSENTKTSIKLTPTKNPQAPNLHTYIAETEGNGAISRRIASLFYNTLYIPPLRSISKQAPGQNFDIISGQNFVSQWDNWANGDDIRARQKTARFKDELRELFRFDRFDIQPSIGSDSLLVTTDDGTFRIEELGDGIGHFILVLGNVFLKQPDLILIDEPENGLHPKMQEVFMRAIASKSKFGVLATSHSIGLARSIADQIFSLTRNSKSGPHLAPFGEHQQLTISQSLIELGYSQFVELGGNNLLLVEGRTDIKAFKEIIRKYGIEHHFIIWSLGGAEFIGQQDGARIIVELDELRRLNPKSISVIFDSEKISPAVPFDSRFKIFHDVCKELNFHVFPTEFHSTENYINQAAIDNIVGDSFKALQPFEKFGAVSQKWDKNKNWLMFREMKKEDFNGTELENFITTVLMPFCQNNSSNMHR